MRHQPVLVEEVIKIFSPGSNSTLLDATIGNGGHAAAYLQAAAHGRVVGLDVDPAALQDTRKNLGDLSRRVHLINTNFAYLNDALTGGGIIASAPLPTSDSFRLTGFDHILFDLGIGSHQLDNPARGFSFQTNGPLNMQFGPAESLPDAELISLNHLARRLRHFPSAHEIVHGLTESELSQVIRHYGEERLSGRIAAAIKTAHPSTTKDLSAVITDAVPLSYRRGRIHPATRTFQALRLAANRELESLTTALPQALNLLHHGGTLAVISFHSLEDRIVKNFFKEYAILTTKQTILTRKPIRAHEAEIAKNNRSRSAKLRAIKKT